MIVVEDAEELPSRLFGGADDAPSHFVVLQSLKSSLSVSSYDMGFRFDALY
jgi:hypothetical protein